jgi:hypothetical protein
MLKRLVLSSLLPLAVVAIPSLAATKVDPAEDPRAVSAGFLNYHPDLQYRGFGTDAYAKKDFERAHVLFRRAAFFADKPSQAMIGEMYSRGEGVPRDMALAYVWMDLAAERGYVDFIRLREHYWTQMDEAMRERAVTEGQALYAKFGDAAAKPRFATQLRRGSKEIVGSRTGFAGNVKINIPGPSGEETIDGTKFKDISYWDADQYWKMQDRVWRNPSGARIIVGDAEVVRDGETGSRIPKVEPEVDAELPPVDEPR